MQSGLTLTAPNVLVMMAEQAARAPDAVALCDGDVNVTYGTLWHRTDKIATSLRSGGAGSETLVGLALPRSVAAIEAIIGIWKARAAYVVLDPAEPRARISQMLDIAKPLFIIVSSHSDAGYFAGHRTIAFGDLLGGSLAGQSPIASAAETAYVLFTSGTTGTPKGVVVAHGGVAALAAAQRALGAADSSRVVQFANLGFDASLWEIVMALSSGATLAIAPDDERSGGALASWLTRHSATHLTLPPSVAATMAPEDARTLRTVVLAGEACSVEVAKAWADHCCLIDAYGPTEATVCATMSGRLSGVGVPDIGRALAHAKVYVLHESLTPTPAGVVGELYIAGTGVARGYLRAPGLTAEHFVADPFAMDGSRIYRTGDRVRLTPDGALEFVGRFDRQVKLRGHRIELGEVELALREVTGAADAVVVSRQYAGPEEQLVGYIVSSEATVLESARIIDRLKDRLPAYMLPAVVVSLTEWPRTPNGKIDRQALPEPSGTADLMRYRVPRTPVETLLCDLFAEVLNVGQVGLDDDFFAMGGHSLTATRLVGRIGATLGVELNIHALFETPTPAGVASAIDGAATAPMLSAQERPDPLPLSPAQRGLWFIDRLDPTTAAYNMPTALELDGALDADALAAALTDVVERHETLRTIFPAVDGEPRQQLVAPSVALQRVTANAAVLEEQMLAAARRPFDLRSECPIRAWLYNTGPQRHVLLIVVHHIAIDGWSTTVLCRDLARAYAARRKGDAPNWAPLPVQYSDFMLWQQKRLGHRDDPDSLFHRQLAYWKTQLSGLPLQLTLPSERSQPLGDRPRAGAVPVRLGAAVHARLSALAREERASLFMVIHAALAALLTRWGAGADIPIGTPIGARIDRALDEHIGLFVNTLVLRLNTGGNPAFADLVGRARTAALSAYGHADVPFESVVEAVKPERALERHPLFRVMLAVEAFELRPAPFDGLRTALHPLVVDDPKFDLSVVLAEHRALDGTPDGISGGVYYRESIWERATAERFARALEKVLSAASEDATKKVMAVDLHSEDAWSPDRDVVDHPSGDRTVLSLLAAQVKQRPDAVAVVSGAEHLTYAGFDRATRLVSEILIARGAAPERAVAVCLDGSVELPVAVVGVLKSGAAYVPIDPDVPPRRRDLILATISPVALLSATIDTDPATSVPQIRLPLDRHSRDAAAAVSSRPILASPRLDAAAYVMFTSGSTGTPKGVIVSHRSFLNVAESIVRAWDLDAHAVVASLTPISVDFSLLELVAPLTAGASVRVIGTQQRREPAPLLNDLQGVTVVHATPRLMEELVHRMERTGAAADSIGRVATGGDLVTAELHQSMRNAFPHARHEINYGPTESTIICANQTLHPKAPATTGRIGEPIPQVQLHLLDVALMPVPRGVAGELYVGGVGVSRGYWRQSALTAARFIADPFAADGSRLYRTGDQVIQREDGTFTFLGRLDTQVKVRGFRVELGEVEAALRAIDGVAEAAVKALVRAGETRLAAYVVPAAEATLVPEVVRRAIAERLPSAMVPALVMVVPDLPRTASGKLDRHALPEPHATPRAERSLPPTAEESILCTLFSQLLGVEHVDPDDDFFGLGGHSLAAMQLVGRLQASTGVDVPVRHVFAASTPRTLAAIMTLLARRDPPPTAASPAAAVRYL